MRKILIIDDNKYIKIALSLLFEESGFEPITADDSETALKNIQLENPSLIILDKKLPDGDGISLLKKIKDINPNLPCIMLTAYTDLSYADQAVKAGAYAFVTKPFNNDEFIGIINDALTKHSYKQDDASYTPNVS